MRGCNLNASLLLRRLVQAPSALGRYSELHRTSATKTFSILGALVRRVVGQRLADILSHDLCHVDVSR